MSTETEGTFEVGDVSLYTKTWTPTGPVKAKLIFVHGFSDHVNRYYGLFPHLASSGIQVHGFDQRGWGRSVAHPSQRGLTGPTALVLSDLAAFISSQLPCAVPLFVMGHSMGGGQVLALASTPEYKGLVSQVRGWVLEAPFLGFPEGEAPSALKVFLGRLAGRLLPRQSLVNKIPVEYLSRDPEVQKNIEEDELCHDTGTLEGLAGLLDRTTSLSSGKWMLSPKVRSLFLAHGTLDKATCFKASKEWFDRQEIGDSEFKSYEGCLHQLHADLCREEFYVDVSAWILKRVGDGAGVAEAGGETREETIGETTGEAGVETAVEGVEDVNAAKAESKL